LFFLALCAFAQDDEEVTDATCLLCHDAIETPATAPAGPEGPPRFHAEVACVDCHLALVEFDTEELEHEVPVAEARCVPCHYEVASHVRKGLHERADVGCADCHMGAGNHDLRSFHGADRALVAGRVNALCTSCHSELIVADVNGHHGQPFDGRTCLACHDAHDTERPPAPERDADCLLCHSTSEETSSPAETATSVHGEADIACVLCHTGLADAVLDLDDDPPHPTGLSPVRCGTCHAGAAEAHARGVHDGALESGNVAAACTDCHGTHDVLAADDPRSPVAPRRQPETCESCHRPSPPADHPAPAGEQVKVYETSIHGRLLLEQGLVVSATCSSCHGSHEILATDDPESATSRTHVPYVCGACHAGVLEGYLDGVHGADFLTGDREVPVCTDCHSEHAIEDPALEASSVSESHVAETCSRCHGDDELAQSYGFETTRLASWGRSYHGIASSFGAKGAANCASCHGFHAILPSSDPRSRVHPANLEETCGGCHPSAGAAFARVPVHSVIDSETNWVPWIVRTVYAVLVALVIGAFILFILVDLFGRLRMRLGWGPPETQHVTREEWPDEDELVAPGETFLRMGRQGRLQHAILVVSFLLLVVTGLPVFLYDSEFMRSVITLEGGFQLRSDMHRVGALGLIGLSLWHLVAIATSGRARSWFLRMVIRPRDFVDFFKELMFNLGLAAWLSRRRPFKWFFDRFPALRFDRRPCIGRYGLVERLEYGAVVWGNLVMIASGAILWRPGWFLDWMPMSTFEVCRVVHGFEATLAFLAIIIWHMYHVHLRPDVFPMSRTWLTGRISRREMRHHHPREYIRILEERRRALIQPARGDDGDDRTSPPSRNPARADEPTHPPTR
jgi:cytochrome b subunit of formate dehydrogenase